MNISYQDKFNQKQSQQLKDSPLEGIPEDWEGVMVNDIAKITTGDKDTQDRDDSAEYPFFVRSQKVERIGSFCFDGEAVLTAGDGVGVGKVFHYYVGKFDFHQRVYCMHSFAKEMNGYFFFQCFQHNFMLRVKRFSAKGSVDSVRRDMISKMVIPKPPKPEQAKIAEILSTVDRAIEQTEALIAKQQRIKTGLMQDLLTRGIDEHDNLRSEETHKFKDSPLGRIPVEWEVVTVSSVLAKSPKNGYSPVESDNWNGTYMLGLGCLTNDGFMPSQLKYAPLSDRSTKAVKLQEGDFLISRSNTRSLVGLVGIYQDVGDCCIYPDLMVRLYFTKEVSPEYMEQAFMSSAIRRQIENAATGTSGSMVKISAAIIKDIIFKRPPPEEQTRILLIIKSEAACILRCKESLKKLRSLKTALMQDLLTGKKRVTVLLSDTINTS